MNDRRRMVKCYFVDNGSNAKCIGYVSENFARAQGNVTYFEEWFLLPLGFSPRRKTRSRIVQESVRTYTAAMRVATPEAREVGARFFPVTV